VPADDNITDLSEWVADNSATIAGISDIAQPTTKNLGELWQSTSLAGLPCTDTYDAALRLAVSTVPNTYGIFSIFIDYGVTTKSDTVDAGNTDTSNYNTWIEVLPGVSEDDVYRINTEHSGWSDNKLMLKPGLNCICVRKTCDLFIKTTAQDGLLFFDELRLVSCEETDGGAFTQGLNLAQIGYLDETEAGNATVLEKEQQVLQTIRSLDSARLFYYNVPIESNVAIDFSESDTTNSTLMNPYINYDVDNINNNFVISKIDIKHLDNGLQIARSSRLN
jgi:hypothetical protein